MEEVFFERVHKVTKQIPYGRVSSYGAIASYLGNRGSARMVGWAMNASKSNIQSIPAHRVVNSSGLLSGKRHFGGSDTMRELLESEGIIIVDDKIQNFEKVFWDPTAELV